MLQRLEELYTADMLSTDDLKKALQLTLGVQDFEFSIYAADPYIPGRWCLYLPEKRIPADRELVVDEDELLLAQGYRIVEFTKYKIFDKQRYTKLAYRSNIKNVDDVLLDFFVKTAFVQLSYNLMYLIRSRTIIQSYRSKDLDTFWHRAINDVALPIVKCEAGSVFIRDDRTHLLKLRGTSGLNALSKNNKDKKLKRDIYYLPDDDSWVVKSLRSRQSVYEFENFAPLHQGRYSEHVSSDIWSRA